jgi:hypothetical protein
MPEHRVVTNRVGAKILIEHFGCRSNEVRRHSSLGQVQPVEFKQELIAAPNPEMPSPPLHRWTEGGWQCREVIEAVSSRAPRREWQQWVAAIQRLIAGLLFSEEDRRMLRRVQMQADDVGRFALGVRTVRAKWRWFRLGPVHRLSR